MPMYLLKKEPPLLIFMEPGSKYSGWMFKKHQGGELSGRYNADSKVSISEILRQIENDINKGIYKDVFTPSNYDIEFAIEKSGYIEIKDELLIARERFLENDKMPFNVSDDFIKGMKWAAMIVEESGLKLNPSEISSSILKEVESIRKEKSLKSSSPNIKRRR